MSDCVLSCVNLCWNVSDFCQDQTVVKFVTSCWMTIFFNSLKREILSKKECSQIYSNLKMAYYYQYVCKFVGWQVTTSDQQIWMLNCLSMYLYTFLVYWHSSQSPFTHSTVNIISGHYLRVVQKGYKKILKLVHGCIKGVSRLSELSQGIFKGLTRLPPYLMYLSYMSNIIGIIIFFRHKIVLHFWYYHLFRQVVF